MNAAIGLRSRVQEFLGEQRNLGFRLESCGRELLNFASFAEDANHLGAVTHELTAHWARDAHGGNVSTETSTRRLVNLRPFLRWLQQFESTTEVPDDSIFGTLPGRKTPHIYRADEVLALMQEAGKLGPADGLRAATYATLFGLIASTGLRIGEALGLADVDVDLVAGVLTVRGAKFGKSRLVPVHPSVIAPLAAYRAKRMKQVANTAQSLFWFVREICGWFLRVFGRARIFSESDSAPAVDKAPAHRTSLWTAAARCVTCPPLPDLAPSA